MLEFPELWFPGAGGTMRFKYGNKPNAAGLISKDDADDACYVEVANDERLREKLQKLFNDPQTALSAGVLGAKRNRSAGTQAQSSCAWQGV